MRMPVFRGTKRWLALLSCLLLSSILFAACGENSPSILNTAGPVAANESFLFWVILIVSSIVFLGVEGALVYSIIRFRERPGMPNPRQLHGNTTLELLWTAIPTVILLVVLVFTIRGLLQVAPESEPVASAAQPKIEVTAIGHQWWWEFHYSEWNITTADSMHVPVGTTVHVNLFSNNVIHSFWVPALTGKTDVIPGHANMKWFVADKVGTYTGICAEYCGTQHANMRFNVVVDTQDSFKTWVSGQQQNAVTPAAGTLADQGLQEFKNACTSCHGIVGVDNAGFVDTSKTCVDSIPPNPNDTAKNCPIGPNLTHFGGRNLIAGGVLENNKAQCDPNDPQLLEHCNLAKWLNDPQGVKPGNDMAIGQLNHDQIKGLVAYLESLQ